MNNKELLDLLLSQHKLLKSILGKVALELKKIKPDVNFVSDALKDLQEKLGQHLALENSILYPDAVMIENDLKDFEENLAEHLKLEDGVFYPRLLQYLKDQGQSTKDTENFIAQMKVLGSEVYGFLGEYKTPESILSNLEVFSKKYGEMTGKILLRVAMEEEGVYMYLSR